MKKGNGRKKPPGKVKEFLKVMKFLRCLYDTYLVKKTNHFIIL